MFTEIKRRFAAVIRQLASEKQLALVEMEIQRVLQLSPVPDTFTEAETETTLEEFNMEADLERYKTTTTELVIYIVVERCISEPT